MKEKYHLAKLKELLYNAVYHRKYIPPQNRSQFSQKYHQSAYIQALSFGCDAAFALDLTEKKVYHYLSVGKQVKPNTAHMDASDFLEEYLKHLPTDTHEHIVSLLYALLKIVDGRILAKVREEFVFRFLIKLKIENKYEARMVDVTIGEYAEEKRANILLIKLFKIELIAGELNNDDLFRCFYMKYYDEYLDIYYMKNCLSKQLSRCEFDALYQLATKMPNPYSELHPNGIDSKNLNHFSQRIRNKYSINKIDPLTYLFREMVLR